MDWDRLLSTKRVRQLGGGRASNRSTQEARTEFDRDYDRAMFSTPVRRLQDKAQVFPLEPNDSVRTRLTHSLEVSTLARSIAKQAEAWLIANSLFPEKHRGAFEAIAATCGLLHDLGNPPFGHAGEAAIADWFNENATPLNGFYSALGGRETAFGQDFLRFEGNAQTIRIVSRLQVLSDRHGINLTCGTMSALMKYTAASTEVLPKSEKRHERSKPGYFQSERDLVVAIREETGTGSARNPITYIVEACDDIVYSIVDIEDAVRKGVISWKLVDDKLKGDLPDRLYKDCMEYKDAILSSEDEPLTIPDRDEAEVQAFRVAAITMLSRSVLEEFSRVYPAIAEGEYHSELVEDCAASQLVKSCKSIAVEHVYTARETLERELAGRHVIHELLSLFWEAARSYTGEPPKTKTFAGKLYGLMSPNYRVIFEDRFRRGEIQDYCRMQLVTDYICGMTDSYACNLHRTLRNI